MIKSRFDIFMVGLIVGMFVGVVTLAITLEARGHDEAERRQGQIDALTGKIHYELITHDDSTRTWERIE